MSSRNVNSLKSFTRVVVPACFVLFAFVGFREPIVIAQVTQPGTTPDCPYSSPRELPFNNRQLSASGTPDVVTFEMYPCETFTVDLTFAETSPGIGRFAFAQLVSTYGGSDYNVTSDQWSFEGSTSVSIPTIDKGRPFNGAHGNYLALIKKIRLWADTPGDPNDTTPVLYSATVKLVPKEGYNQAGLGMMTAAGPLYDNSTIKLSMQGTWLYSIYSYYRFSLAPGGQFKLTGTITNRTQSAANLVAEVYNADGSYARWLFDKSVAYVSPPNYTETSAALPTTGSQHILTNPSSSQVRDYYIGFSSTQGGRLFSAEMSVDADTYEPKCSVCQPSFNGTNPAWLGTRKIYINVGFNDKDKAAIQEALNIWNKQLAQLKEGVVFELTTNSSEAHITVFASPDVPGGMWAESTSMPSTGRGSLFLKSGDNGIIGDKPTDGHWSNLVTHVMMHELGHALDFNHVNPLHPSCGPRDTLMWEEIPGKNGPFPGITCADCNAVIARPPN